MNDSEPPIELPALHQGLLSDAELRALFTDLAHAARVLEVRVKGGAEQLSADDTVPLESAYLGLCNKTIRGVQIRYLYQGTEWIDTVLAQQGLHRVVRMKALQFAPGAT